MPMLGAALSMGQRKALRGLAIAVVLLGAAATALALGFEPWLRARVQSEAARHGVSLEFEDFEVSWGLLTLHRVSFQQDRPLRVVGTVARVAIELQGFQASAISLETSSVDVQATRQEILAHLNAGTSETPEGSTTGPLITAQNLTLNWRPVLGQPAPVSCAGASFSVQSSKLELQCKVALAGLPTAALQLHWDRAQRTAQATASSTFWPALRLSATAKFATDPLLVSLALPETPLPIPLSLLLGVPALQTATVSGRIELRWPLGLTMQTPGGTVSLTVKNFKPPHPVELQGFDFGTQTDLVSDFSLSRDQKKISLKNIRVQAGSFSLTGDGALDASRARVNLQGSLSCALLARAAAEAQVGSALGKWAGKLASKLALQQVEGRVAFDVDASVDFDGKSLPRIDKRVQPGCGLKPLKLEELAALQLPEPGLADLAELGARLGELLPKLPATPSLLPDGSAQPLPGLPMPGLGTPRLPPGKQLVPAAPSASATP
jgi:hypothetical protein